jgi:hypothetical protein
MTKVRIKGVDVEITEEQKSQMKYFEEYELQNEHKDIYEVDAFESQYFKKMIEIMELAEYNFPEFSAVSTNNLNEVIGEKVGNYLSRLTIR